MFPFEKVNHSSHEEVCSRHKPYKAIIASSKAHMTNPYRPFKYMKQSNLIQGVPKDHSRIIIKPYKSPQHSHLSRERQPQNPHFFPLYSKVWFHSWNPTNKASPIMNFHIPKSHQLHENPHLEFLFQILWFQEYHFLSFQP